jgi:hypothetical protein
VCVASIQSGETSKWSRKFGGFFFMPEADLFLRFIRPLNQARMRYVLTGSVAAIFYGEPRLTHDADFVVVLNEPEIHSLAKFFTPTDFYVPPAEVIGIEAKRESRGHFNIIHLESGFKADFYLAGIDQMNQWALANGREFEYQGERVRLAPPEYVIVRKLEYYREGQSEKHLRDIRSILELLKGKLDQAALDRWITHLGLQDEWRQFSKA